MYLAKYLAIILTHVFLTSTQRAFIRENCSQAINVELQLVKTRPFCAKVMSVVKVRHREEIISRTEAIIENLIGIKGVLKKSIEIDWIRTGSSVYVFPFDGYDWRPVVFERADATANTMNSLLLEQVITDRFSTVTNLALVQMESIPIHVFGVSKYVAIRTSAYPTFSHLISNLQK